MIILVMCVLLMCNSNGILIMCNVCQYIILMCNMAINDQWYY